MKPITKKILESGLVDETMAIMMEKWGVLEEGASELTKKEELKNATREQLMKFADEIGDEVEKERRLHETMLDLNHLRWPTQVKIYDEKLGQMYAGERPALIDRMGRYYFRPQDVQRTWFVPGRKLHRIGVSGGGETILEVTELYVGDQIAAIQVSTQ